MRATTTRSRFRRGLQIGAVASILLLAVACGDSDDGDGTAAEASDSDADAGSDSDADAAGDDLFADLDEIAIVVPGSVGGGSDTQSRLLAPLLSEYLPGNPTVTVENAPDVPTITVVNDWNANAPTDGSSVLISSTSSVFPALFGQEEAEYTMDNWIPLAGVTQGAVAYTTADTGITDPTELYQSDEEWIYAGQTALGGDTPILLAFEILEMSNAQAILGYDGRGPARIALESGESNINYDTSASYLEHVQPRVDEGEFVPLFSFGQYSGGELVRDPLFPDIPHIGEVYEAAAGQAPSGPAWVGMEAMLPARLGLNKIFWVPEGTSDEIVDAFRQAFVDINADEGFIADKEDVIGPYDLALGDDVVAGVNNVLRVSEDDIQWLKDWLKEKYDVDV